MAAASSTGDGASAPHVGRRMLPRSPPGRFRGSRRRVAARADTQSKKREDTMKRSKHRPLAVVTGASSGIGLELGRQFAEHDFDLLVAAEDSGIKAAAESMRDHQGVIDALRVDLATEN